MAANGVNLDALIPREDFATLSNPTKGSATATVGIASLADEYWVGGLRKPDFQRETANWNPGKIVDLVAAFLDGDLIPAIILWRSGQFVFVIDGAHRMSALLAWIYDDYGDRSRSIAFFEGQIPEEQKKLAQQTRDLMAERLGSYEALRDAVKIDAAHLSDKMKERIGGLNSNAFIAQWVPAVDAAGAENSFFKINQAPTPVDPVEKKILKGRMAANAIATRAVNRGGVGHRYWKHFEPSVRVEIEKLGKQIYEALYTPPLGDNPIKSSDVPVGGRGYSALPFLFDFVNLVNGVGTKEDQKADPDGQQTIGMLNAVKKRVWLITTVDPGSLGLHPLVYFYTRGGAFQPVAFLAVAQVVKRLVENGTLDKFTSVRGQLEAFLMKHKEAFTLIVKRQGAGSRSRPALEDFITAAMTAFADGKTEGEVIEELIGDVRFDFLAARAPVRVGSGEKRSLNTAVKTAAFITALEAGGTRCAICGGLLHRNSMTSDHTIRREDGGSNHSTNIGLAHPYCNTGYKERATARSRA